VQQGLLLLVLPRTPMDNQCTKKPRGNAQGNGASRGLDTGLAIERTYDPDRTGMPAVPGSMGFEPEVEGVCALLAAVSLRLIGERVANRARLRVLK
jgi:hypothetical protein